jgi:CBS domain-containing protein
MTKDVLTVMPSHSLAEAAQVMVERDVGAAMVVEKGALVGIITERDLLRALARSLVPWGTPVSDCMTSDPITIEPEASAGGAVREMIGKGFRHLPVMQGDELVGIVSLRDLVTQLTRSIPSDEHEALVRRLSP